MFPLYATIERKKEAGHNEMSTKDHGPGGPVPAAGPPGRVQGGPEAAGRKDRGVAGEDFGVAGPDKKSDTALTGLEMADVSFVRFRWRPELLVTGQADV